MQAWSEQAWSDAQLQMEHGAGARQRGLIDIMSLIGAVWAAWIRCPVDEVLDRLDPIKDDVL